MTSSWSPHPYTHILHSRSGSTNTNYKLAAPCHKGSTQSHAQSSSAQWQQPQTMKLQHCQKPLTNTARTWREHASNMEWLMRPHCGDILMLFSGIQQLHRLKHSIAGNSSAKSVCSFVRLTVSYISSLGCSKCER